MIHGVELGRLGCRAAARQDGALTLLCDEPAPDLATALAAVEEPGPLVIAVPGTLGDARRRAVRAEAEAMGFLYVASGPLVRSSYRAGELFVKNILDGRKPRARGGELGPAPEVLAVLEDAEAPPAPAITVTTTRSATAG